MAAVVRAFDDHGAVARVVAQASMPIMPGGFSAHVAASDDPVQRAVLNLAGLCQPSGGEDDAPPTGTDCPICLAPPCAAVLPTLQDIQSAGPFVTEWFSVTAQLSFHRYRLAALGRGPPLSH
ncbi:hypothetical protein [Parvularcula sp. LCG005]|uniref:hypothetical protein n=1 Tax=Parvularcula sp. LCG005 TaxID=3078805 RepID=UPI00294315A3|nr:hypothetical protein [Parvularcula sp. LCG005]WOI54636.1 hypothetical protein RUI03_06455 [Parvularcula sp. LCG005]